jgi:hypothetical protein
VGRMFVKLRETHREDDGYYDDTYAYDDGYAVNYSSSNGFVCQPGTWFRGEDGYRHLCQ